MEQIKLFIEKAKSDSKLMTKLDALGKSGAGAEEVIALAAEYGFTVTVQEYEQAAKCGGNCVHCGELSEADLDAVSGGVGAITQNRYDPNVCPNLSRTRYECVGFWSLVWCDHLRHTKTEKRDYRDIVMYRYECAMGAFDYYADGLTGDPTQLP